MLAKFGSCWALGVILLTIWLNSAGGVKPLTAGFHENDSLKYIRRKRNVLDKPEPAPEFSSHTVIQPKVFDTREKQEIDLQKLDVEKVQNGTSHSQHLDDLTIAFASKGQKYIVDLQLNHHLIPNGYFQKFHKEVCAKILCNVLYV